MGHLRSIPSGGNGLTAASVDRLTDIFGDEIQSTDELILRQADGLKAFTIADLAAALGTTGQGWTPASLGSSRIAIDFGRRDTLYSDTARTTPSLQDGTNVTLGGVTDLSGTARHLSQGTSGDRPRYNSSALVAGRGYCEVVDTGDHMDFASAWVAGADAGSSYFSLAWTAYLPTAALQADSSLMVFGGTTANGMGAHYDATGKVRLRREDVFGEGATTAAPLDEWHTVVITFGYVNGLKIWVNGVAQAVTSTVTSNTFAGDTQAFLRSDVTGWNSGPGGRVGLAYGNGIEWTADQVAQVNSWLAVRAGI